MKKFIASIAVIAFSASMAMAADVMTFPAKPGNVTFPHKKHQEMLKDCKICHQKGPGKIEGFGKEFAHSTCKACHADKGAGPTKCFDCHKK
ncbi:cytochrome c family protein [Geomonas sp. Red32]|uniref:cytochrome c7 n=1 Tax=Geomonas sp. Red32 TaxID=2912856 RepID=UPI00202CBE03|nr:cytochrome c7 [Geomonas sp. Red32]MCM0080890.1 cytochrome c family protein [Geomonas sp. Red32]